MYDPLTGRFCSRDPIGYRDGQNLYRAYFSPQFTDPSGMTLTVHGNQQQRIEFLGLLDKLCPDAGGFTQTAADGNVQPGNRTFCDDKLVQVHGVACTYQVGPLWKRVPGPYSTSNHPISCTCICRAIKGAANYKIRPWEIPFGMPWENEEPIRPSGGRVNTSWPYLENEILIGKEQGEGYSGTGDPDFGRPGRVRGPKFILLAHELCGHAVPGDYDYDRNKPIDVENDIRDEHGVPGHRDGKDHTEPIDHRARM